MQLCMQWNPCKITAVILFPRRLRSSTAGVPGVEVWWGLLGSHGKDGLQELLPLSGGQQDYGASLQKLALSAALDSAWELPREKADSIRQFLASMAQMVTAKVMRRVHWRVGLRG